jgi:hypothetical protein
MMVLHTPFGGRYLSANPKKMKNVTGSSWPGTVHSRFSLPVLSGYSLAWIVVFIIVAIDFCGTLASAHTIRFNSGLHNAPWFGILICVIVWINARTPHASAHRRWDRHFRELGNTTRWMLLFAAFLTVTDVLTYLSVTVNAPLIDDQLIRFDRFLGFDWVRTYQWVYEHRPLWYVLEAAYESGLVQAIAIPVVLGMTGRRRDLTEFVACIMVASVACLAIATLFPAASAFLHFGIDHPNTSSTVSQFLPLRSGSLRIFDLDHPQGLVSMPSFHTIVGVLFAYSLRHVRYLFPFAAVLNLVMIVSTPTQGGHYLADLLGGLVVAAATTIVVRISMDLLSGRDAQVPARLKHIDGIG